MPREVFIAGQILTAAEMNTVSDQTVMSFAGTAARGSAIPSPVEGMTSYLEDLNRIEFYNGSAWAAVGTILQVVSTTKADTFTSSSTSYTDITGLSATITPSSTTSKVLIIMDCKATASGGGSASFIQLVRGSTAIGIGDASGSRTRVTAGQIEAPSLPIPFTGFFLDSPNTTSATTYKVQGRNWTGSNFYVNRTAGDSDASSQPRSISSIVLMEVAG